jgi:MFS family permease
MTDTKALREVLGASPLDKEPKAVETVESGNESTGVENLPQVRSESQDEDGETTVYLRGLRFAMVSLLIGILVFLVSAEATIVVTALVAITKDFGEFTSVSWIMSSFQLGFVATIVVSAKLSDLFGRKTVLMTMIALFTAFSAGCALAQTITQLIVMRGLQGLGAGGCYTLCAIIIIEIGPPEKYGKYAANASIAIAMGTVLGPVIGGAVSERTTWRWIFWFNLPVGVLAFLLAGFAMPTGFPRSSKAGRQPFKVPFKSAMCQLDLLGSVLLVCAVVAFAACFQEAGSKFSWDSAYVVTLMVAWVVLWSLVLVWERRVTLKDKIEPVLPWRFFTSRAMVGILAEMALVGAPMSVTAFQIPQRFQLINGLSGLDAGIRLLPFGGMFSVGSMVGTTMASKLKIPAVYLIMGGSVFQIIGFALLGTLPATSNIQPAIYGYLVLIGFGCGLVFIMAYLSVPFVAENRDKPVGMAAANQFRMMGSAIGIAVATSVFNGYVVSRFKAMGVEDLETDLLSGNVNSTHLMQEGFRDILSEGYNRQMLMLCAFSAAQIPVAFLMWSRNQIVTV